MEIKLGGIEAEEFNYIIAWAAAHRLLKDYSSYMDKETGLTVGSISLDNSRGSYVDLEMEDVIKDLRIYYHTEVKSS